MTTARVALALLVPLSLAACAVPPPSGPSVLALPAKGKDLQTFQAEDMNCRNYATAQIGGNTPAQAANQAAVGSAAIGTGLGAAAGALSVLGGVLFYAPWRARYARPLLIPALAGALAGWLPARRAARIDPVRVLRES